LNSEVKGEIGTEDKILVIKRIHVTYHLKLDPEKREAAERAHSIHIDYCPVARTIRGCVDISTDLVIEEMA
jgi:uncharacterized OsmC-like protein